MSSRGPKLTGKVCLVTGATRGIGKGIALQLGQAGATVYITGRTLKKGPKDKGSLEETAEEIESRGGRCIPVVCDHSKDEDIQKLFEKVKTEQDGQLDVLVNSAFSAVTLLFKYDGVPFWEQPWSMWDDNNVVGLRNHYLCTVLAARLMVPRKTGLIVIISSAGGLQYFLNPAYGCGKEACDRMAADCGKELRKHNVAVVSLWPGFARSEEVMDSASGTRSDDPLPAALKNISGKIQNFAESVEYSGIAIAHLASDPKVMSKSGRICLTEDLGSEYKFLDIDGKAPNNNMRSVSFLLSMQNSWLANYVPRWIKIPCWLFYLAGYKF